MPKISRRQVVYVSASAGAIAAGAIYAAVPSVGQLGAQTKPVISFGKAKADFMERLSSSIDASTQMTGAKYTSEQITDIQNRAWSSAQSVLAEHYAAEETPKELREIIDKETQEKR